jgi:hypothetical protein
VAVNAWLRLMLMGTAGVVGAGVVLKVVVPLCGGPDLLEGGLSGLVRELNDEAQRSEALGRRDRQVVAALEEKEGIVRELAEGRLTLREALERFRLLREGLDDGLDEVVGRHPAPRDDEGLYRTLRSWVDSALHHSPRREKVLARLEGEWQLLRARRGAAGPGEGPATETLPAPVPAP